MHIDDQHNDNQYNSNQYTDDQLDSALHTLDPADQHIDPLGHRASADLEAILATDPGDGAGAGSGTAAGNPAAGSAHRRRGLRTPMRPALRRAALVGAAAAVLAVAIVAVPTLLPDGDQGFTSWAAVPEPLAPEQRPEAGAECRKLMADGPGGHSEELESAAVAIAEQRGAWTTVVLTGEDGFTATCISQENGMFGTLGNSDLDTSDPRMVQAISLGTGMVHGDDLSALVGYSGADVTGVTYASETHGEVVATVSQERFALWMPGDELRDAHRDGVEVEVTYSGGGTENVRLAY